MGILEEIHEALNSIDQRLETVVDSLDGGDKVDGDETRALTAKEKAAAKRAAKAAAKKAAKTEMTSADFTVAVKALASKDSDAVRAARNELFDSSMKVRDIPAEERQSFLDRVQALIEEDDI